MKVRRPAGAPPVGDVAQAPQAPKAAVIPWAPSTKRAPATKTSIFTRAVGDAAVIRRSPGPEGTKPLLTRHDRARLTAFFDAAPDATQSRVEDLLRRFKTRTAPTARGVILKAVLARSDAILDDAAALEPVEAFAERIARWPSARIAAASTVLDLDSTDNTSDFDSLTLYQRRGVIHPVDSSSTDEANNDGMFQRFTASCGPTVLQMMLCEADPVTALEVHEEGLVSDSTSDGPARFQRKILEECGGVAIGRREAQLRARLHNALGRLKRRGAISQKQADLLARQIRSGDALTPQARRALDAVRKQYDGFPDTSELKRLKAGAPYPKVDEGISTEALVEALGRYVTPATGVTYQSTNPTDGFARGQAWRHLDAVTRALRQGMDVPFGVQEPAHWMLLTHVKGNKPNRSFLVSDPDGGRTAWVREKDLRSGVFVDRQFHLSEAHERPFVDCFVLPKS